MDLVTVTGTENLMMALVLPKARPRSRMRARAEVVDLAQCLSAMGARIKGAGTDVIVVEGVARLHAAHHRIMADRIEAGTFLAAAAATGGRVTLHGTDGGILDAVLEKLREAGAELQTGTDDLPRDAGKAKSVNVRTAPIRRSRRHAAQLMALDAIAEGTAVITETFSRTGSCMPWKCSVSAPISRSRKHAIVRGVPKLQARPSWRPTCAPRRASSSRSGRGGRNEGRSGLSLDRGYECIEEKLAQLGARIKRIH